MHIQPDYAQAAQWYHWTLGDTKVVDSICDAILHSLISLRNFLIFWSFDFEFFHYPKKIVCGHLYMTEYYRFPTGIDLRNLQI